MDEDLEQIEAKQRTGPWRRRDRGTPWQQRSYSSMGSWPRRWSGLSRTSRWASGGRAGLSLVSLGFRVGNPSAIGWHQAANFPASLLPVGGTPTTSKRIVTRSLRRKMALSRHRREGARATQGRKRRACGAKDCDRGL